MFFIVEGCVEIYLLHAKRRIGKLFYNSYFGEIGYFSNQPRTANAICITFTELLMLDYEET